MKLKSFFLFLFSFCAGITYSATVDQTIYINRGVLTTFDNVNLPYLSFNSSPTFNPQCERILLEIGDSLNLLIKNTDTGSHFVSFLGLDKSSITIKAGDSAYISHTFNTPGLYIYTDSTTYGANAYLGLTGMIYVRKANENKVFFWNIREQESGLNQRLVNGEKLNPKTYDPDYFFINGRNNPEINQDAVARPIGNVGDTLFICVANTGMSVHSLHFHGYHAEIMYSSKYPHHVGRSKDTHPVYPLETLLLRFIPDKPGEYPVHDHNLVAVTGGGLYPNGMFLTILISP